MLETALQGKEIKRDTHLHTTIEVETTRLDS